MGSLYYRCCWHRVCNPLFSWYNQNFSHAKAVYNPKAFFLHAASLDQAFAHCRIFSTAATRRCTSRVSVSSLGNTLSRPLPVIALVSRYLTNKLIGPRPLLKRHILYCARLIDLRSEIIAKFAKRRRRCASALQGGETKKLAIISLPFGRANFSHLLCCSSFEYTCTLHSSRRESD